MTLVERTRLEFNEMSRSSSESLTEITAADEYGAAVIKATESNLSKKKRKFRVRFSPSRLPSPLQEWHHASLINFSTKVNWGKKKRKAAVMWCLIQKIFRCQNKPEEGLHKRKMMKTQKWFKTWKEIRTILTCTESPCTHIHTDACTVTISLFKIYYCHFDRTTTESRRSSRDKETRYDSFEVSQHPMSVCLINISVM